jgi:hypothetical protein
MRPARIWTWIFFWSVFPDKTAGKKYINEGRKNIKEIKEIKEMRKNINNTRKNIKKNKDG